MRSAVSLSCSESSGLACIFFRKAINLSSCSVSNILTGKCYNTKISAKKLKVWQLKKVKTKVRVYFLQNNNSGWKAFLLYRKLFFLLSARLLQKYKSATADLTP
jgi:hypothetical protein